MEKQLIQTIKQSVTTDSVAQFISLIFHPLLMPSIGIFLLFHTDTYLSFLSEAGKNIIYITVFTGTFLIPISFIPLYMFQKIITDVYMENNRERLVPLFFSAVFYFSTLFLLQRFPAPKPISGLVLACAVTILCTLFINMKWKISSHMIGVGGLVGLLISIFIRYDAAIGLWLIIMLVITGLVGTARLQLNAHSPKQVYSGFIFGMLVTAVIILFY